MPEHGGALNQAIKKYNNNIAKEHWLDLSTGINPYGWPVPAVPQRVYNRLPEADDGLLQAAYDYYQVNNLLPVAGSQQAIQILPELFLKNNLVPDNATIGIIYPCYAEHEFQWQKNNFSIIHLSSDSVDQLIDSLDLLIVINPNNPTGELIAADTLRQWQQKLATRQAYLIIDEAFIDSTPQHSILAGTLCDNVIVLRSVGKFFGLAGLRCGFIIASHAILSLFQYYQGPWSVSGPARYVLQLALSDTAWIASNKILLQKAAIRLEDLLIKYILAGYPQRTLTGTVLFKTIFMADAELLFEQLAEQGVLVRLLDNKQGLRFGLPGDEQQWQRLEKVFRELI